MIKTEIPLSKKATTQFAQLSWPSTQDEPWRRTDLTRLLPKGFLDSCAQESSPANSENVSPPDYSTSSSSISEDYAAHIVMRASHPVSIILSEEATKAGLRVTWVEAENIPESMKLMGEREIQDNADRISVWHWRDMRGALAIHLPHNQQIEKPIFIEECLARDESTPRFIAPHLHLELEESAELQLVWSFENSEALAGASHSLINAGISVVVEQNASARLVLRQNLDFQTSFFLNNRFQLKRDGRISFIESQLGGSLIKTHTGVVLDGEGADAKMKGIYLAKEGQHMDIGTTQEHSAPHTTSDALYKGVVLNGGRSIFQGLIEVAPKATKTDSYLTNRNLVLDNNARADSIPQLNILTDDVKCSHGSTTGKLDEGQLFYLQSRGFSPTEAVRELTRGFLMETLSGESDLLKELLLPDISFALGDK